MQDSQENKPKMRPKSQELAQHHKKMASYQESVQLNIDRKLPAKAVAIRDREPSAYTKQELRFSAGDEILVTAVNMNGQWEGQLENGRKGYFPFTHVKFVEDEQH